MIDSLYTLTWLTRPLMQQIETTVEAGLAGTGLTVRSRAVMEILHHHGALTVPALADQLHIQRQYVQVMMNEALAAGFVTKQPNPRHARSVLIALTTDGAALIERVMRNEHALLNRIAGDLPPAEVAAALTLLQDLHQRFKTHNEKGNP